MSKTECASTVIADLRAQLEAAKQYRVKIFNIIKYWYNRDFDKFNIEILSMCQQLEQDRDNLQEQLKVTEQDKYIALTYCQEANKTMADNDKNIADIQAQVGVLRDEFKKFVGVIDEWFGIGEEQQYYVAEVDLNIDPGLEPWYSVFEAKKEAEHVLSATPEQAGEKVRGLVEALEFYANPSNYEGYFNTCPEVDNDEGEIAREALAKFRGGADGETNQNATCRNI